MTGRCGSREARAACRRYWQFPILYGNFGGGRGSSEMDPDSRDPVGRAGPRRRHAGWPEHHPHAGRLAPQHDRRRGRRHRPRASDAQGSAGRLPVRRRGRPHRPPRPRRKTARASRTIRNFYEGNEFIKSTDPFFRPVDQTTAPDGTIYITDMYHGIIQEAQWSGPRHLPARPHRAVRPRQGDPQGTHLAPGLRRHEVRSIRRACARHDDAAYERRDAGAARRPTSDTRTAGGATPHSSCSC